MKFTGFFWDFDGTLFDTYPRINRAMQKAFTEIGMQVSIEQLLPLTKVSLPHTAQTLAGERAKEVLLAYNAHAEDEGYDTMPPFPGAIRLLQSVCAHGGHNYLYTHRSRNANADGRLSHDRIAHLLGGFADIEILHIFRTSF